MSEKKSIAEELVEATRREAVGQVARWLVNVVRFTLLAAFSSVAVAVWALWSENPVATVALLVASLAIGFAVGAIVASRNARREIDEEVSKIRSELNAEISGLKDAVDVLEHGGFTDERIASLLDVLPGMPREQRLVIGRAVSEGGVFISNAKTEPIARSLVKDGYLREESRGSDTCASYSVPAPLAKEIVNDEKVIASLDDATVVFNERWVRKNP